MLAPLFTELNVIPICYHRITLCLRYSDYALHLPPTHLVYAALRDSLALYSACYSCWIGDLDYALAHLDVPVMLPAPRDLSREGRSA
ncbi:hypothetical protein PENSPDRAFT_725616 [Peniophora sp. CONT]|nr:hypothetical protein PENSPDRAFT_725616 [Peniophora sp. CONT]